MVKYIIQRLIAAFLTFIVILIVVFFVLHSMPGDIIDFSPKLDPAIRECSIWIHDDRLFAL